MNKLAIFVSGSGTNMENLVKHIQSGDLPFEATLVICDKPGAGAIERAGNLGVQVELVNRKDYDSKESFEAAIDEKLAAYNIEWIALAGFMRILSEGFVNRHLGKLINIHPSYLPSFPGAHAIKDAFEAKVPETGVTVHFVTPEVDAGPVILQKKVPVEPSDTLESLEERVHALEYEIYPEALKMVASGQASFIDKTA